MHACNCMYGTNDPRCCVARAHRRELEEAHRLGREGKPLPPVDAPPPSIAELNVANESIARINAVRL